MQGSNVEQNGRSPRTPAGSYIYFARSPLRPGLIKIGRTRHPRQRAKQLDVDFVQLYHVPDGYIIKGRFRVPIPTDQAVEAHLHTLYAHLRVRGPHASRRYDPEWFRAEQELAHLA